MARAEQLADLFQFAGKFGPGGSPDTKGPVGFHQGQIVSWEPGTGRNSVRVLGTTVNDLPILSTTDSTMLTAGDTVGVLRFRQTYFLLGRIIPPGGEPRTQFRHLFTDKDGFAGLGAQNKVATVYFTTPPWATNALIIATSEGTMNNTSGQLDNLFKGIYILGGALPNYEAVEADYWVGLSTSNTKSLDVTPGQNLEVSFAVAPDLDWPFHSGNYASLSATAIFSSN